MFPSMICDLNHLDQEGCVNNGAPCGPAPPPCSVVHPYCLCVFKNCTFCVAFATYQDQLSHFCCFSSKLDFLNVSVKKRHESRTFLVNETGCNCIQRNPPLQSPLLNGKADCYDGAGPSQPLLPGAESCLSLLWVPTGLRGALRPVEPFILAALCLSTLTVLLPWQHLHANA